jgi:hypothetical protein
VFNVFLYKDDVDRSDLNLNGLVLARAIREGALANHPGYASFLEGNEILTIKDEFRNMPFLTSGTLLYKIKFSRKTISVTRKSWRLKTSLCGWATFYRLCQLRNVAPGVKTLLVPNHLIARPLELRLDAVGQTPKS